MDTAIINYYNGYRHNRFDSYSCSWGVLMGMGASNIPDCFADDEDYPNDDFNGIWEGDEPLPDNFKKTVLFNLDCGKEIFDDIKKLSPHDDKITVNEYWGKRRIDITFSADENGIIICDFDGEEKFICEF